MSDCHKRRYTDEEDYPRHRDRDYREERPLKRHGSSPSRNSRNYEDSRRDYHDRREYPRQNERREVRRYEPSTIAHYTVKNDVKPTIFGELIEARLRTQMRIDTKVQVEPFKEHYYYENYKFGTVRIPSKYYNDLSELSFEDLSCFRGTSIPSRVEGVVSKQTGVAAAPIAPVLTRTEVGTDGKTETEISPSSGRTVSAVVAAEPCPVPLEMPHEEIIVIETPVASRVTTQTSTAVPTTVDLPLQAATGADSVAFATGTATSLIDLTNGFQVSNCVVKNSPQGPKVEIQFSKLGNAPVPGVKPEKKTRICNRRCDTGDMTAIAEGTQTGGLYFKDVEFRLSFLKSGVVVNFKSEVVDDGSMKFIVTDEENGQTVWDRTPTKAFRNFLLYLSRTKGINLLQTQGVQERSVFARLEKWFKNGVAIV